MNLKQELELLHRLGECQRQFGSKAMMRLWIDTEDNHKLKVIRKVSPVGFVVHDNYSYVLKGFTDIAKIGINCNMKWEEFNKVILSIDPERLFNSIISAEEIRVNETEEELNLHKINMQTITFNCGEYVKNYLMD